MDRLYLVLSTPRTGRDFPGGYFILPFCCGCWHVLSGGSLLCFAVAGLHPPALGSLQLSIGAAWGATGSACFCQLMAWARQGQW